MKKGLSIQFVFICMGVLLLTAGCSEKKETTEKKTKPTVQTQSPIPKLDTKKEQPAQTDRPQHPWVDQIQTQQRSVKIGDTYQEIILKFGDPQVEYPLSEIKTCVSYPHTKFIFSNQKLISAKFLSRDEMINKGL